MVVTPETNKKKRVAPTIDSADDSSDGDKKQKAIIQFRKDYQREYNASKVDKVQGVCLLVEAVEDWELAHSKNIKTFDNVAMRR
jgi:hypothetical protein